MSLETGVKPLGPPVAITTREPGYGDSVYLQPYAWDEGQRAHEAHASFPALRRAVDIRKNSISKLPLCIYSGPEDTEVEIERRPGNIVDVWERSGSHGIVEELQASLDLRGNGYLRIEENNASEVTGFYTLPAHRVTPVPTPDRSEIRYYRLVHAGKSFNIPPDEIVHIKEYAPGLSLEGIAPFRAAFGSYTSGTLTQQLQSEMVRRGGEFAMVLTSPDGRTALSDPAKQRRLKLAFKKRYRQPPSRRGVIATPAGVKVEKTQLTPAEMRLPELQRMSREQIYEVYGVPLWLVGMQEGGHLGAGGAARSAERVFYEHTVDPMAMRLAWALTNGLFARFDPMWHCRFDFSGVFCLQLAFLERAELVTKAVGRPVLTVNEGRAILDEEPLVGEEYDTLQAPTPAAAPGQGGSLTPGVSDPSLNTEAKAKPNEKPKKKPKMQPAYGARTSDDRRKTLDHAMEREAKHALTYVNRLLAQQEARLVTAVSSRAAATRTVDLASLLSDAPEDKRLVDEMIEDLVDRRGNDALAELVESADFNAQTARVAAHITQQANRALSQTTETTRQLLNERMAEQAGESTDGLIAIVRSVFDDRRENAVTIARTESASAFNFATIEAWHQTDGMVKGKRWVAILDEHTREAHAEADGQEVGLDEPFEVGGEALNFPGDPNGSAENTINCRCTVDFVLAEERGVQLLREFINKGLGRKAPAPSRNGNHAPIAALFERGR